MHPIVLSAALAVAFSAATMAPPSANAEPKMLTVSQLEAVTAAGLIPEISLSVPINVTLGGLAIQNNVTIQTAIAFAFGTATCVACWEGAASAIANALALNSNLTGLTRQR